MLGLALGDALGGDTEVSSASTLRAGAATHLAAWTAEGLLRRATRYGGIYLRGSIANSNDTIRYAYQRWAALRGLSPQATVWHAQLGDGFRGWLQSVPEMALKRGHSPSIERAIATGVPSRHDSCRPMIKGLPIAVFSGAGRFEQCSAREAGEFARGVAEITHRSPNVGDAADLAVRIAVQCLRSEGPFGVVLREVTVDRVEPGMRRLMNETVEQARKATPDIERLAHIAPNDTSASVLRGAVYTALVFPEWTQSSEALDFASRAPDGDGVAALVGAFLGALHGYEVFAIEATSRLELGWVMDRLAIDLALEARSNQVPDGGWKEGGGPWEEPWWDAKYPGV